jgi:hypothetical protein
MCRTIAPAVSALNATKGAYLCGMLNSDNTRGYLISRLLHPVCGFGRGAALPSEPFYTSQPSRLSSHATGSMRSALKINVLVMPCQRHQLRNIKIQP